MAQGTGRMGRLILWCSVCEEYHPVPARASFDNLCPRCGMFQSTRRCTRCGREWTPKRFDTLPTRCPSSACRSPYWCRERTGRR